MRDENQTAIFSVKCTLRTRTNYTDDYTLQRDTCLCTDRLNCMLKTYLIY